MCSHPVNNVPRQAKYMVLHLRAVEVGEGYNHSTVGSRRQIVMSRGPVQALEIRVASGCAVVAV